MKKKVIVFGLGKIFEVFKKIYDATKLDIVALSDNNKELFGKVIDNVEVVDPGEITKYAIDFVFITSSYFSAIREQLVQLGIDEEKLVDFSSLVTLLDKKIDLEILPFLNDQVCVAMFSPERYASQFETIIRNQEKSMILSAQSLIDNNCDKVIRSLEEVEFKVFSQFGEDGIIQWLIHNTKIQNKIFVEFGVEDYTESNTRFLLMNNNWTGVIIDGSESNIEKVKSSEYYWRHDLTAIAEFITKDNINELIRERGKVSGDIGLLSVDIDGNDYWVLDSIDCIQPRILVCEYNSIFGADMKVTVPYDAAFVRKDKHYSCLYWGASIAAFCDWAEKHNYYYVGSNLAGNNAFFVRKDCFNVDKIPEQYNKYIESKFRESRDCKGGLTYLGGISRLNLIKDMEVVNLETETKDTISNLYQL